MASNWYDLPLGYGTLLWVTVGLPRMGDVSIALLGGQGRVVVETLRHQIQLQRVAHVLLLLDLGALVLEKLKICHFWREN